LLLVFLKIKQSPPTKAQSRQAQIKQKFRKITDFTATLLAYVFIA